MQKEQTSKWWDHPNIFIRQVPLILSGLISFFVYALTAAHTVTFEDSGLFIYAADQWGVLQPPGYPLFSLLGHLFTYIPIGSIAYRVALFSAVCGGLSTALIFLIFKRIFRLPALALLGALLVSFSSTIWSQMIVAEVYPLNFLISLLFLYQFLCLHDQATPKRFFLLGLTMACALGNHWPLFVLMLPGLIFILRKAWFTRNNIAMFLSGLMFVIVPYALVYWRSQADTDAAFLGSIEGLQDLFRFVLRSYYATTDVSVLHTLKDNIRFLSHFAKSLLNQDYVILCLPLFLLGLREWRLNHLRPYNYMFTYFLFSTTALLLPFLRLEFNDLNLNIYQVFWLIPYLAFGYFVVSGAHFLEIRKRNWGVGAVAVCVCAQFALNFSKNNLSGDHFAEDYARTVLSAVPDNKVLFASTDGDVGPIAYVNKILKYKPTVELYTGIGLLFRKRLYNPRITSLKSRYEYSLDFVRQQGDVYAVKGLAVFIDRSDLPFSHTFNGVVYHYAANGATTPAVSDETLSLAKLALDHYISEIKINNWAYHRGVLAARLCNILVLKGVENHKVFEVSPECQQVLARHMMSTSRRADADTMFMRWLNSRQYPILFEVQQYMSFFLINRFELINSMQGQPDKQKQILNEGIKIAEEILFEYPLCDNMVAKLLLSVTAPLPLSDDGQKQLNMVFRDCVAKNKK